ncbi:MAG: hypothetical protein AAFY76_05775, partial [Cyanobacteria bacterium J06649_11]
EYRIEYTSLSKARNFPRYRNLKSDLIGGQSMGDVHQNIFEKYPLELNTETNDIQIIVEGSQNGNGRLAPTKEVIPYVYYYYTDSIQGVNKGILLFHERGGIELRVFSPRDVSQSVSWFGTYKFSGMYLFVEVETGKANQFKSLQTYFSGVPSIWQKFYVGTYNGIRADGTLFVGKGLLQKVSSEEEAIEYLHKESDPKIANFLEGEVLSVETKIVLDLASL